MSGSKLHIHTSELDTHSNWVRRVSSPSSASYSLICFPISLAYLPESEGLWLKRQEWLFYIHGSIRNFLFFSLFVSLLSLLFIYVLNCIRLCVQLSFSSLASVYLVYILFVHHWSCHIFCHCILWSLSLTLPFVYSIFPLMHISIDAFILDRDFSILQ